MNVQELKKAKSKLQKLLSEHEGSFAVGIGADSVEVRLYDETIRDLFPDKIDGIKVKVRMMSILKAR
jgi:hypothetical protein